ncbi:MAG: hypothetical protein JXR36_00790 [Bacteroidales bacterium]|nr:hypothetical protein [Bacteroidales bacterium]
MKNVQNTLLYTDALLETIVNDIIPIYDLWSLRSFVNKRFEYISGNSDEIEKFTQFIAEYSTRDNPPELLLITANSEKNYPTIMLNTSKKYMIIRFENSSDYLGQPLQIPPYWG